MASSHQADRIEIVRTARRLLRPRVKFRPYGRDPNYGMDCIGVIDWVGKQCELLPADLVIPPYAYPPQREAFAMFDDYMDQVMNPVEGAVVVIADKDGAPRHTGIVDWADDKWKCIGIDVHGHRPWVTIIPLELDMVWRFYDFRLAQS
jgi:hypothetical protein